MAINSVLGHKGTRSGKLADRVLGAVRALAEVVGAPTCDQRAALEAFPGWGPVSGLFDPQPQGSWGELADALDEMDSEILASGARVVDTSFFTPAPLIGHIYDLLRAAGFGGGSVLDLGCGSGRFLQHAPADVDIDLTGVEADRLSARIAEVLYPQATIIRGQLQSVSLPHKVFDAAVGNVPFSSANVHDGAISFYGSLHEYFLLRAVMAVRPGGYVVLVSSRHSLDARDGLSATVRRHADLIGAVRLPSGYFGADGTDVVADVLVLRVRDSSEPQAGWDPGTGSATVPLTAGQANRYRVTPVSRYFHDHPRCVAGEMRATGFDRNPVEVVTKDPAADVAAAFAAVTEDLVPYPATGVVLHDLADVAYLDADGRKEGSLYEIDGAVVKVVDGVLEPVARAGAELRALIGIRDAAVALLEAESDWDRADSAVEPLRVVCRERYEGYVALYGALNRGVITEGKADPETGAPRLGWRAATLGGFRSDPDAQVVLALEVFDQDTGECAPAPILSRRVNRRPVAVSSAATAGEALAISLGEGRGLDLARIAGLLGLADEAAAFEALGELVFRNPGDGRAVTARDYLSGNVRAKLRDALAAASADDGYSRNVSALQAIQPAWLGREDIRIELGSPLVTASDVADFCEQVLGRRVRVNHVVPLAAWEVYGMRNWLSSEAVIAYSTQRFDAFELLQIGLNGAAPTVWDEVYDEGLRVCRRVRNADETEAAEQKLAALGERFSLWVWEDRDREQRLAERYNDTMNAHVLRRHDGSHLTFPGLADGVTLWPWQRDFVDQAVSTPAVFCAHSVGLGKTLSAIALAMTVRQFGLANRPALVVPNHLIEQATRQAYQAWPSGKFLIITREDLHAQARRRFAAKCATGEWDLIIMTHETFSAIPVPAAVERDWLADQLNELECYSRSTSDYSGKRIAAAVRALQSKIERLRDSYNDPNTLTFPMIGIDYLIVDEADKFRRLPVTTRAEGFSLGSSKRAVDLLLKISMLRRASRNRPHAALLAGTPFTNTLAEAYVWQKLLAPDQLQDSGLAHFDAWAAQFIRYEVIIEVSPDGGGFRSKRRPSVIQNVPELRTMLAGFMSMVRAEATGLSRPEAIRETVVVEPTGEQRDFMASLVTRADDLRMRRVEATADNMLLICGDGRKVALDPNLVGIGDVAPKIEAVAAKVSEVYHQTRDLTYPGSVTPGAFQLVLCDLGTPKVGDNQTYGRIRAGLISRGVPAGQIRFIHEATTPKAREALFAGCRDGSVAVLIGSTPKVGIGSNIQRRLHTLHHVDPTWTAAAWEQRNGRAIRHGNHHGEVGIVSFVSENTFDAFMFGVIERKARGFEQLYRHDGLAREIEDLGDGVLSFGELKAAAAGNTLLLRQHELATVIRKLRLAHMTARQNVNGLLHRAAQLDGQADVLHRRAQTLIEFGNDEFTLEGVQLAGPAAAVASMSGSADGSHWGTRWMQGQVMIQFRHTDDGQVLDFSYRWATLWSMLLPAKVRRRGAGAVEAWAKATVASWIAHRDDEITGVRQREADALQRAGECRATVAETSLEESEELTAAKAELAEVNRQISEELADTSSAQAA